MRHWSGGTAPAPLEQIIHTNNPYLVPFATMKIFCLGGAGRISREAVLELVQHSQATPITVADVNAMAGRDHPRGGFRSQSSLRGAKKTGPPYS